MNNIFKISRYCSIKNRQFFYVQSNQVGLRIDQFIQQQFQSNWANTQKLIRMGEIQIDEKKIKNANYRLKEGQTIQCPITLHELKEKLNQAPEEDQQIDASLSKQYQKELANPEVSYENFKKMILYEDASMIVINKPNGYSAQGGSNPNNNIPHLANNYLMGTFKIVHRLDQNVSGIMFGAKSKKFASTFGKLLDQKENFIKEYLCVVTETPKQKNAIIEVPLRFDVNKQMSIVCNYHHEDAKICRTAYDSLNNSPVLKVRLYEGRKHQIRAHMSQVLKTPILFDTHYSNQKESRDYIMLHSYETTIQRGDEITDKVHNHVTNQLSKQQITECDGYKLIKSDVGEVKIYSDKIVYRAYIPQHFNEYLKQYNIEM